MITVIKTSRSYDSVTILLHWLTALLVLSQWFGAHAIDWFPRGWQRTDVRSIHIVFGVALALAVIARLAWRWTKGRSLPATDTGLPKLLASFVHGLLYVLIIATLSLGIVNTLARGDSIFDLFSLPKLHFEKSIKTDINQFHGLCANAILCLAGAHAAAALWRQYLRKDGILSRMIPALNRD